MLTIRRKVPAASQRKQVSQTDDDAIAENNQYTELTSKHPATYK